MDVEFFKTRHTKGAVTWLIEELHWSTMDFYDIIRRYKNQLVFEVSGRLKEFFDYKAMALLQSLRDVTHSAARDFQKLLAISLEVLGKHSSMNV